jgi:GT2 family glycosyltransferase
MIKSALMKENPDISIIFVYFETPKEIINALRSIKKAVGNYSYEVIIVDNYSLKPLPKDISKLDVITIRNKSNVGYGKALNQGAKLAKGKYLLLSNPDVEFKQNSISLMVDKLGQDKSVGIIGPQFLDSKNNIQMVGSGMPLMPQALFIFSFLSEIFPENYFSDKYYLFDFDRKTEKEIPALCGACFLIRKTVFEKIKGFDERFFMYFEEADICKRISTAGFKILYYPKAKVVHLIGKSSENKAGIQKIFEESRYKFFKKYQNIIIAILGEGVIRLLRMP